MPEVKRREIQRRKHQRERLWRDDEGGADGGGALRRTAKKILVKQLKEWREKEAKQKKGGDSDGGKKKGTKVSSRSSNGGALAPGFTLPEDSEEEQLGEEQSKSQASSEPNEKKAPGAVENMQEKCNDEVISIDSNGSKGREAKQKESEENNAGEMGEEECPSENDWEMSIAVQSSIDDSIRQQQKYYTGGSGHNNSSENPFEHEHYGRANNATIASLPSEARSQWIDRQKAAQRIQSRKDCIRAAADPEDYSSTQLRNFLKGSKLNKRVNDIGKLVERRSNDAEGGVDGEDPGDSASGFIVDNRQRETPELQRLRRRNNGQSHNDADDDDDIFDSANGAAENRPSMRVLFGEDDTDDENGGGGFLPPSPAPKPEDADSILSRDRSTKKDEVVILDNDDSNEDFETQNAKPSSNNSSVIDCKTDSKPVPSKQSKDPDAFPRSALLEFSAAGKEWEEWGAQEVNIDESSLEVNNLNDLEARDHDMKPNDSKALYASDSASDDEDETGLHDTFLGLGEPTKVAIASTQVNELSETHEEDDNEEDDGIDWEDGNSGDSKSVMQVQSSSHDEGEVDTAKAVASTIEPQTDIHCGKMDIENDHSSVGAGDGRSEPQDKNDVIEIASDDDVSVQRGKDITECGQKSSEGGGVELDECSGENEFATYQPNTETTAALQHAQGTASRLTSWAGRAFQRAISAHVEETKAESHSPKHKSKNDHVDLTVNESVIDEADTKKVDIEESSRQENAINNDDETPNQSPEQRRQRDMDLFDTSLEGLDDAHNAIMEEERAMERDMSTITEEMKEDILALLQLCGIPWVESPSEAEAQCAALENLGLVNGVVTEDSDVFVFGAKKVYKNFFNEQKYVEAYFARDLERELALKKHQLVALAMLLGGDYTDGVKGVGIVNAFEILSTFTVSDSPQGIKDGLKRFRDWLDGFGDPDSAEDEFIFHKKHRTARTRWIVPPDFPSQAIINAYLKPAVDKSKAQFSWAKPDVQGLQRYCAETLGWEKEETDRVVNPVLKVLESGSKQTRLESYFMKYEVNLCNQSLSPVAAISVTFSGVSFSPLQDNITFAKVRSKRLKAVLEGIGNGKDSEVASADGNVEHDEVEESKPKRRRK
ncbi:hypothetical protein ACHAWF_016532 [Thalassiosira exigua]